MPEQDHIETEGQAYLVIARIVSPPEAQTRNREATGSDLGHKQISHLRTLNRLLIRAVKALGDAGEPDLACRIAAEAWATLRMEAPDEAERLNGALHYLTRPNLTPRKET
jgi:hypothetical protein